MEKHLIWRTILCLMILLAADSHAEEASPRSILSCLPSGVGEWRALGNPRQAEGQDLFRLINGGAEFFLECGFRRAAMQTYAREKRGRVNLDVFEMESPAAASRVYAHNAGGEGKQAGIGEESMMAEYYLIFRKGPFHVTLTGFDSERETLDGLVRIAKAVEKKLSAH